MSEHRLSASEVLRALAPLVPVAGTLVTLANYANALTDLAFYANTLTNFASNPQRFIFRFISEYIVGTAIGLGQYLIGSILLVFNTIASYLQTAAFILVGSFQVVTTPILVAGQRLIAAIATAVVAAGPAGPVIAAALTATLLYSTYRLLIAVAGEIPVGSSIVDLLGLR